MPRLPNGKIDWLLVEGDVMGAMMIAGIVALVMGQLLR
jgi:hypothetical protein